jgi:hypothetical protein
MRDGRAERGGRHRVTQGSFTVGAFGFSDDGDRGALAGLALVRARDFHRPAAVAARQPEPISQPAIAERRAHGRADHVFTLGHLGAAKLLTPANEGDPMAATALTPHRVNHLIPPGTEEPR